MCMCHIVMYRLPISTVFFHIISCFLKKVTQHETCVLFVSTTFVWNSYNSKKNWGIKNVNLSSCKVLVILVRFNWNLSFLDRSLKNNGILNFMKNLSSGSQVVPCRQTHEEANSHFSFAILWIHLKLVLPIHHSSLCTIRLWGRQKQRLF
jgi:hypothetical protein